MKELLAKIESCDLNYQDRKILVLNMVFAYEEGMHQGIGGLVLDRWDEDKKVRVGTAGGLQYIIDLLDAFDANNLSDLVGEHCFVLCKDNKIRGLRSLREHGQKEVILFKETDK